MKKKLNVTWQGSEASFVNCETVVAHRLRDEKFQWKRNDKEFPQQVELSLEFVEFSPSLLRTSNLSLYPPKRLPAVCHLFFIDISDPEKYKGDVRGKLAEWFSILRDADTNDWLIVFDSTKARETKTKNAILEKLRTDFSKFTNRIVEIFSVHSKGAPILIRHVVETVLSSLDLLVQSYEAALKIERDNCFSAQWTFWPYFFDQLQLTQIFASLSLYDAALAQLEEVDAMFSLLVSHFAPNLMKPQWLVAIAKQSTSIFGVMSTMEDLIESAFAVDERNCAESNLARIRTILLSYQLCLVKAKFAGNVSDSSKKLAAETVLKFGFVTLNHYLEESAKLSTQVVSVDECLRRVLWGVELLKIAENYCEIGRLTSAAEAVCNNWLIICREVELVRKRVEDERSSTLADLNGRFQKHFVAAGISADFLNSTAEFDAVYVSAIAILKHMGWNRNAKMVCLTLARFYLLREDFAGAVQFYSKILRYLRRGRFELLYNSLLVEIDEILKKFPRFDQFNILADLSCGARHRFRYFDEFRRLADGKFDEDEEKIEIESGCEWLTVKKFEMSHSDIFCGSKICVVIQLDSRFPGDVRLTKDSFLCCNSFATEDEMREETCAEPILRIAHDVSTSSTQLVVKSCRSKVYKRNSEPAPCKLSNFHVVLPNEALRLKPGCNSIEIDVTPTTCGVLQVNHLHVSMNSANITLPIGEKFIAHCFVNASPSHLILEPTDILWVGITQYVRVKLKVGTDVSRSQSPLHLTLKSIENELSFPDGEKSVYEKTVVIPVLNVNEEFETTIAVFVGLNGDKEDRLARISCEWPQGNSSSFDLIFKSLLAWSFETHPLGSYSLVSFIVTNFSSKTLRIDTAELELFLKEKSPKICATLLNQTPMDLSTSSPYSVVWKMNTGESYREALVSFTYSLSDAACDEKFECWAKLMFNSFHTIEACCQVASESAVCRVDSPCDFVISLKADHKNLRSAELLLVVLADGKFWRCLDSTTANVTLKENGLGQATVRLTPQCVGYLPLPSVDVRIMSPLNIACQIYVRSRGKQIHVLSALMRTKTDSKSKITF